jgi:hypothetical protein
LFWDETRE